MLGSPEFSGKHIHVSFCETFHSEVPGSSVCALECITQQATEFYATQLIPSGAMKPLSGFSLDVGFSLTPRALRDAIYSDTGIDHNMTVTAILTAEVAEGFQGEEHSSSPSLASSLTLAALGLHPTIMIKNLHPSIKNIEQR